MPLQGCGIVWPTTIGKLELNICKVLKAESFDRLTSQGFGLQVGLLSCHMSLQKPNAPLAADYDNECSRFAICVREREDAARYRIDSSKCQGLSPDTRFP